jgi:hypothetical protein
LLKQHFWLHRGWDVYFKLNGTFTFLPAAIRLELIYRHHRVCVLVVVYAALYLSVLTTRLGEDLTGAVGYLLDEWTMSAAGFLQGVVSGDGAGLVWGYISE